LIVYRARVAGSRWHNARKRREEGACRQACRPPPTAPHTGRAAIPILRQGHPLYRGANGMPPAWGRHGSWSSDFTVYPYRQPITLSAPWKRRLYRPGNCQPAEIAVTQRGGIAMRKRTISSEMAALAAAQGPGRTLLGLLLFVPVVRSAAAQGAIALNGSARLAGGVLRLTPSTPRSGRLGLALRQAAHSERLRHHVLIPVHGSGRGA
jgi:hypothetical protein